MRDPIENGGMRDDAPRASAAPEAAGWGRTVASMAVIAATGVAIRDLPLSPERVWHALQEAGDRS